MEQKINYIISGKYTHFKGNEYTVFCVAKDETDNFFVLYRANYAPYSFWIRPYNMFFEKISNNGKQVFRFKQSGKKIDQEEQISNLISILRKRHITITQTETSRKYIITRISIEKKTAYVQLYTNNVSSGYLTEYELAHRLGYHIFSIENKIEYSPNDQNDTVSKLEIGDNKFDELVHQLNPCSIDLQIAESGFLIAKRKKIDPLSIEHVSNATELWKKAKVFHSKRNPQNMYIKIHPNETVLTHTLMKIHIPNDCAGKIEIKSTFARLSISITTGDFCNPDYHGYFPLEITNNGKHTIIIHAKETMAQLMLLPLQGVIIEKYSQKATYIDDDGTPFSFWRERSLKTLRKKQGTQPLIDFFYNAKEEIKKESNEDVNAFVERFDNTFLTYCQKCINNKSFIYINNDLPNPRKIVCSYIEREKALKTIKSIDWIPGVGGIIISVFSLIIELYISGKFELTLNNLLPYLLISFLFMIITIILKIKLPSVYCTFENLDIDKILNKCNCGNE